MRLEEEGEECQREHASEYPRTIREKRHADSAWEYLRDEEEEEESEREKSPFRRKKISTPYGFFNERDDGEKEEECWSDIEEIVFGDAEEIAPSHRISVNIDIFLREEEIRMDVREISREGVGYVERVLADMREVREDNDSDEDDGEGVSPCEMEECGAEGEAG